LTPMATLLRQCKHERILMSVDYPFARNEWGTEFLSKLRSSGMVGEEGLMDIAWRNAARLLRIEME
jgi:predicted TIM-barrel fold metal-dependent hydrolase